jgi:hypothetical protein
MEGTLKPGKIIKTVSISVKPYWTMIKIFLDPSYIECKDKKPSHATVSLDNECKRGLTK